MGQYAGWMTEEEGTAMETTEPAPGGASEPGMENRIREIGESLLAEARERKSHFWAREHWEEGLLQSLMENRRFRLQALRFVDVLPTLRDDAELARHVGEYYGSEELPLPGIARWGIEQTRAGKGAHLAAAAVRTAMHAVAHRFIGGTNVAEALHTVEELRRDGMAFTLDLLGEATVSEVEAAAYSERYLTLLREIGPRVARWRPEPLLDHVSGRPCPRLNLSVKLSALYSQMSPIDPAGSIRSVLARLRPILRAAREQNAFICLDMEQYDTKGLILQAFREVLMEPEFRDWPDAGLAKKGYLREPENDIRGQV